MEFDISSFLDTAPTSWFAAVNWFLVIYKADTHNKFVLICPPNAQGYFMPFEQKIFGKTSFCAQYLVKNSAHFSFFLSLKHYFLKHYFYKSLRVVTWDRTGERFYCGLRLRVTFESCPCRVREFVPKYMLAFLFPRKWIRNSSGIHLLK
jgi:hypothetical protein